MSESTNPVPQELPPLQLQQLAPPEPIPMRPDTVAWNVLFSLIALGVLFYLYRRRRRYVKEQWRREALALAETVRQKAGADDWFRLIQRIYLVHNHRAGLAALADAELLAVLPALTPQVQDELVQLHYQPDNRLSEPANQTLYIAFTQWVTALPRL